MPDQNLQGYHILIVEDEYLLADDLCNALADAGAEVLGPVASIDDGLALIESGTSIDAAVLDVNLRGDMVFPVADALRSRGVPFAFATGYDESALPERYSDTPRLEKPTKGYKLAAVISSLLQKAD
jgi:DNA-binding response OmpR family regulator